MTTFHVIFGLMCAAAGCAGVVMFSLAALSITFDVITSALDNAPTVLAGGLLLALAPRTVSKIQAWYRERPLPYRF